MMCKLCDMKYNYKTNGETFDIYDTRHGNFCEYKIKIVGEKFYLKVSTYSLNYSLIPIVFCPICGKELIND